MIKRHSRQTMRRTLCPIRLWDYCFKYTTEVKSLTVTDLFQLNNRTPSEIVMGYTPYISDFLKFEFYNWIWYWEPGVLSQKENLGRWLGVARSVGQGLAYYVLKDNGQVVVRNTLTPLTKDGYKKTENKVLRNEHTKMSMLLLVTINHILYKVEKSIMIILIMISSLMMTLRMMKTSNFKKSMKMV